MNLDEAIKRAKEAASEQKEEAAFARQAIMNAINFPPALNVQRNMNSLQSGLPS